MWTTDECFVLTGSKFLRTQHFKFHVGEYLVSFSNKATGTHLKFKWAIDLSDPTWPVIVLKYTVSSVNKRITAMQTVPIQTTMMMGLGRRRYWFSCPLKRNGFVCGRRIEKLYLPPNDHHFGCRHCHDLTYRSSQVKSLRPYL